MFTVLVTNKRKRRMFTRISVNRVTVGGGGHGHSRHWSTGSSVTHLDQASAVVYYERRPYSDGFCLLAEVGVGGFTDWLRPGVLPAFSSVNGGGGCRGLDDRADWGPGSDGRRAICAVEGGTGLNGSLCLRRDCGSGACIVGGPSSSEEHSCSISNNNCYIWAQN